jgi:FSR family fosmidomycin resistance protein-like MFS transporter
VTEAVELPLRADRSAENRLISGVCFGHFVSHYYIMLLAPLFVFIRADYDVSYTELGLALTASNVVSTLVQTPMGFLVDRMSARLLLIGGLVMGACAIAVAGLVNSFWVFVAMFGVLGLANTVYHPADYALLSQHVASARAGRVFSFHTFAGMAGNAVTPPTLLFLYSTVGWRGAFLAAAVLGLLAAIVLVWVGEPEAPEHFSSTKSAAAGEQPDGWRLLLSPAIVTNLIFFILLSFCGGGLNNYLVVGLGALHGTPLAVANTALTSQLTMSAVGVLVGGILATYTTRHGAVAAGGLAMTASVCMLVGLVDFNALALVLMMATAGFCAGMAMPSRDLIVRAVTPPGAYGRVFGFVSTGFNIAGIVSPTIFGQFLDHGHPRGMFFFMAGCALLAIGTVVVSTTRRRRS